MAENNEPKSESTRDNTSKDNNTNAVTTPTTRAPQPPAVLAGAETLFGDQVRIGAELRIKSSGGPSALRIADVSGIPNGQPVYITKPIKLEGKKLRKFLVGKKVLTLEDPQKPDGKVNESYGNLIADATISIEAFYFTVGTSPLLMMFDLELKDGLITSLTGDEALGELFDITGASVRLLRCKEQDFPILQKYAAQLIED
jgi:hypothetical protein